jgi:PTS system mannose-specific IIA component
MSQPTRFDVRATTISSIAKESIGTMIGLVLVTHGRLAVEFVSALEHVVGAQRNVGAVCIGPEDDMEMRRNEILDAVARCDTGAGVVVLTDMFGGTPSNLAISIMDRARIEVIAGVNLPMLIKLASVRQTEPLAAAVQAAREAGRTYINVASQLLAGDIKSAGAR